MTSTAQYCDNTTFMIQIGKELSTDQSNITLVLSAASRAVDNYCHRPDGFVSSSAVRTFSGMGGGYQRIDECSLVTAVAVKQSPSDNAYQAWTTNDWIAIRGNRRYPSYDPPFTGLILNPNGAFSVFTSGRWHTLPGFRPHPDDEHEQYGLPTVQVTAKWGYADVVPDVIKQATLLIAARWWKRGESVWADAVGSPDGGMLAFVKNLDPDAVLLLRMGRFVRPAVGRR